MAKKTSLLKRKSTRRAETYTPQNDAPWVRINDDSCCQNNPGNPSLEFTIKPVSGGRGFGITVTCGHPCGIRKVTISSVSITKINAGGTPNERWSWPTPVGTAFQCDPTQTTWMERMWYWSPVVLAGPANNRVGGVPLPTLNGCGILATVEVEDCCGNKQKETKGRRIKFH